MRKLCCVILSIMLFISVENATCESSYTITFRGLEWLISQSTFESSLADSGLVFKKETSHSINESRHTWETLHDSNGNSTYYDNFPFLEICYSPDTITPIKVAGYNVNYINASFLPTTYNRNTYEILTTDLGLVRAEYKIYDSNINGTKLSMSEVYDDLKSKLCNLYGVPTGEYNDSTSAFFSSIYGTYWIAADNTAVQLEHYFAAYGITVVDCITISYGYQADDCLSKTLSSLSDLHEAYIKKQAQSSISNDTSGL